MRREKRMFENPGNSMDTTYIRSAFWMVEKRCAMAIVVLPFAAWSRVACTTFLEFESSGDVAWEWKSTWGKRISRACSARTSSNSSTPGFRNSEARAMTIRSRSHASAKNQRRWLNWKDLTFPAARWLRSLPTNFGIESSAKKEMPEKIWNKWTNDQHTEAIPRWIQECSPFGTHLRSLLGWPLFQVWWHRAECWTEQCQSKSWALEKPTLNACRTLGHSARWSIHHRAGRKKLQRKQHLSMLTK